MLRALIWDVDGTLAETERDGHRVAFNRAFADAGLPWTWDVDEYGALLRIAGGLERLCHDLAHRAAACPSSVPASAAARAALAERLHRGKNAHYASLVEAAGIVPRPGVVRVIDTCAAEGIRQAIATTTSHANVAALLRPVFGANWSDRFDAVVCAEEAPVKKPDPTVYRLALERLALDGDAVLAIEDSANGLIAASRAGIATLITRSHYFRTDDFDGAAAICDDLDANLQWIGGKAERTDPQALRAILAARVPRARGTGR